MRLFLNMWSGPWRKSRHNDGVQNTHTSPFLQRADRANQKVRVWLVGVLRMWWYGAEILAWCLTPALYRGTNGVRVRRLMVDATWPLITGHSVLTSLLSVVVIRIVRAAAADHGLSQYALNLLIRTLDKASCSVMLGRWNVWPAVWFHDGAASRADHRNGHHACRLRDSPALREAAARADRAWVEHFTKSPPDRAMAHPSRRFVLRGRAGCV